MSGGVDSAVACFILKKQGFNVEGVHMRNWGSCLRNYDLVQQHCNKLNVPCRLITQEKEYWCKVFEPTMEKYKLGITPNPDIECNKHIKFNLKFEKMATGHYAKLKNNRLFRPVDLKKDQTYFLAGVERNLFSNVLFPLSSLTKSKVKEIAREQNLFVDKESMGWCFVGKKKFSSFLEDYVVQNKGNFVYKDKVIGTHSGIEQYTIGQRCRVGGMNRLYVFFKDLKTKNIFVEEKQNLFSSKIRVKNIYLTKTPNLAQIRHLGEVVKVDLRDNFVYFKKPVWAPAPGQHCVFYSDLECVGLSVIEEPFFDFTSTRSDFRIQI